MINRFRDLAANERTFLAWIRTAIMIMAFGFLVEKFELLAKVTERLSQASAPSREVISSTVIEAVGIALMVMSVIIIITATIRYIIQKIHIVREREAKAASIFLSTVLALLLVIISLLLIVYLAVRILPPI